MGYADVAWLQGGLNRVSLEDAPNQEGEVSAGAMHNHAKNSTLGYPTRGGNGAEEITEELQEIIEELHRSDTLDITETKTIRHPAPKPPIFTPSPTSHIHSLCDLRTYHLG
jgi:hypothetical protein